jgi:hypothetical protein
MGSECGQSLEWIHGVVSGWIKAMDAKAAGVAAGDGVLLSGMLVWGTSLPLTARPAVVVALGAAGVVCLLSLFSVMMCVRPILVRRWVTGSDLPSSCTYFGDISEYADSDSYLRNIRGLHHVPGSSDNNSEEASGWEQELARQIHANSRIARNKARWVGRSIVLLLIAGALSLLAVAMKLSGS